MRKTIILLAMIMSNTAYSGGQIMYSGGTFAHHVSFNDAAMNNIVGSESEESWALNSKIQPSDWWFYCNSIDANGTATSYSSVYLLPGQVVNSYLQLNDYWEVKADVFIAGMRQEFITVPFYNESNGGSSSGNLNQCTAIGKKGTSSTLDTGGRGRAFFKLKKKIVNGYDFISTDLLAISGALNESPDTSNPFAKVVIDTFSISLPEKCEINAGQSLDIDFGNVSSTKLNGSNYQKTANLNVKCTSGDFDTGLSSVYADYIGDTSFSDQYFGSNNEKVGVVVKDRNNQVIKPGDRKTLKLTNGEANDSISLAPVSDGKNITEGEFNANIIIRLNLE